MIALSHLHSFAFSAADLLAKNVTEFCHLLLNDGLHLVLVTHSHGKESAEHQFAVVLGGAAAAEADPSGSALTVWAVARGDARLDGSGAVDLMHGNAMTENIKCYFTVCRRNQGSGTQSVIQ